METKLKSPIPVPDDLRQLVEGYLSEFARAQGPAQHDAGFISDLLTNSSNLALGVHSPGAFSV